LSLETVFAICNSAVIPAWLLLVALPRWEWTERIVQRVWIPGLLALAYGWAFLSYTASADGADMGSLAGVMALFANPSAALAGWIHYLAFDLFVGAWEVRDARAHAIHHGWVIPCLVLTLMAGPLGLLLYFALRYALRRDLRLTQPHLAP